MATISASRPAAKQDAPASHPYSCNTCQVAFRNSDLQKSHMKGDWHRYNLKRRVASLPPISSELFAEKVLQSRASTEAEADRASYERACTVCQKTYFSENSFQNHLLSQKHKTRAALAARGVPSVVDDASSVVSSTFSLGDPVRQAHVRSDAGSQIVDSDAEEEFSHVVEGLKKTTLDESGGDNGLSPVKRPANPRLSAAAQRKGDHSMAGEPSESGEPSEPAKSTASTATPTPAASKTNEPAHSLKLCLFCNYASPTALLSVAHMERFHGMFIPEKQYLVDLEGLLTQLETRIRDDHECIYCGKMRGDVFAVQTHMRDKAHCKIPYTDVYEQLEIGDFYDFRGTYSDSESDASDAESDSDGDDKPPQKGSSSSSKKHSGAKLGAKRATKNESTGEDGWETDSSESSLDSADLTAVPADGHILQYERLDKHPHHSQTDPRAHHQRDGWHSHAHKHNHAVFYDEYELHLPTGRAVGHRSLNKYFRQNLHNYPSSAEREKQMRLAIEAGEYEDDGSDDDEDADAMDVDAGDDENGGSSALTRANGAGPSSRAVSTRPPPRNVLGLAGVSDKTKAALSKSERRAVKARNIAEDKDKVKYSAKSIGQSFRFLGR